MGTNYYLETQPPCPTCGREYESRHIGKSSAGWCFALHVYPEESTMNLEDWKQDWRGKQIVDEYGRKLTPDEMLAVITDRHWLRRDEPLGYKDWAEFHRINHSEEGPNGLLRHRIGDLQSGCVAHGEGTWDYIVGEFS